MSDLSAAAATLGAPEALVQRSAEARAKATGGSVDEVLSAWAGGAPAPGEAPAPAPAAAVATAPAAAPAPTPAVTSTPVSQPELRPPAGATTTVIAQASKPPVLEGRTDRPQLVGLGAVALLVLSIVAGLVVPALPEEGNGVYTSAIAYTQAARQGRAVYRQAGCAGCHTQMVRPLVSDAGLGGVTLSDSNQVLGTRRYGPDLAHIGSRVEDVAVIEALLAGADGHPISALGNEELINLTLYLLESK